MLRRSCCIADDNTCQNRIENGACFECFNRELHRKNIHPGRKCRRKKTAIARGFRQAVKRL
jgi:hypothetical protein